ncbi:cytochrome-18 [Diaporthe helianthi]|uniref:Tyrosine--tRNA ligase n=1 Tax=Diaporthe helianthi TaxID=158607 RepID=A0A2P5HKQ2_DIAHE|nr:cytochrome-18 [Diaporthe helianthi]
MSRPLRFQRRWIGLKVLQKAKDAEMAWEAKAEEIKAGSRKHLFDELQERGLVKDVVGTVNHIRETMLRKRISAYAGVDPTASSLHLGHLLPFMPLFWMYMHGYGAFTLIGGSTARIGDPTGRTESRPELARKDLIQNLATIHYQLVTIWKHVEQAAARFGFEKEWAWRRGIYNNNTWWLKLPMFDVMKRLGTQMRMGPLLSRDNVKNRLQDGSGMSLAEFCYPMMQAWDWYELLKQRGVQLQVGGSDQYGNILTGAACVKACVANEPSVAERLPSGKFDQPIGFTVPLLTDSSGAKFGKTAGNAVWLDAFKTTPYDLYGYLVRRRDDEVENLLKLFTFHPLSKITEVMNEHQTNPPKRVAQHLLAYEVVWLVHGEKVAVETRKQHQAVYGGSNTPRNPAGLPQDPSQYVADPEQTNHSNRPRIDVKLPRHVVKFTLPRIVYAAGLAKSVSDADRTIKNGGMYIGGSPGQKGPSNVGMNKDQLQFTPAKTWDFETNKRFLIEDQILLLRKGKHNIRCIEFVSEEEWDSLGLEYPGQPYTGKFRKAMQRLAKMAQKGSEDAGSARPLENEDVVKGKPRQKNPLIASHVFMPTSRYQLERLERTMRKTPSGRGNSRGKSQPSGKRLSDEFEW